MATKEKEAKHRPPSPGPGPGPGNNLLFEKAVLDRLDRIDAKLKNLTQDVATLDKKADLTLKGIADLEQLSKLILAAVSAGGGGGGTPAVPTGVDIEQVPKVKR